MMTPPDETFLDDLNKFAETKKEQKPAITLIPTQSIIEVARVMGMGATKHKPANWTYLPSTAHINAAFRHISEHLRGELYDRESGLAHLSHAAARLMLAVSLADAENEIYNPVDGLPPVDRLREQANKMHEDFMRETKGSTSKNENE